MRKSLPPTKNDSNAHPPSPVSTLSDPRSTRRPCQPLPRTLEGVYFATPRTSHQLHQPVALQQTDHARTTCQATVDVPISPGSYAPVRDIVLWLQTACVTHIEWDQELVPNFRRVPSTASAVKYSMTRPRFAVDGVPTAWLIYMFAGLSGRN